MEGLQLSLIVAKAVLHSAVFFSVGLVFYTVIFQNKQVKNDDRAVLAIVVFAIVGILSALGHFALMAASLTGDISGVVDATMLKILWAGPVGTAFILRIAGFALILLGIWIARQGLYLGAFGGLVVIGSYTQIGHTTDFSSIFPSMILVIHLVCVAMWVGILLPLFCLSRKPEFIVATGEIAYRFGRLAMIFMPILLLSGIILAYLLLGSIANLFSSEYGIALLTKIVLLSVLLSLAALNKLRLVPAIKQGDSAASQHLSRSVFIEAILILLIFIATATLTSFHAFPNE